jgi:dTDP-4-dehydrorhamnose reductase
MKVLVTGKSGQLGKALSRNAATAHWKFADRTMVDLRYPDELAASLEKESFDVLVNTAAYTVVDLAETEEELANILNAKAVAELARICKERHALLIHISTDYVFEGNQPLPARETDRTGPVGAYGRSKCKGEEAIRLVGPEYLIVRTSWLYGPDGHNFLRTMLRLGGERDQMQVVYDQVGSPTFVDDLALAIVQMVRLHGEGLRAFGTYHYTNEGVASWYDFAHAIFEMAGIAVPITPVNSSVFPTKARRPAYSVLNKEKIKDTFGLEIRHWREALAACIQNMKTS